MSDGGEVSIRFTSKQQEQLWQSFAQLAAKMAGAQQQTEESAGSALKASQALKRLADNTKLLIATPAEDLARAVKGLDEALAANLLTAEEHGRAVLVHQERYQKALEATDVALIAQREAAKQSAKEQELAARAKEKAEDQAARKAERDLERQQATLAKVDEQWDRYAESMRAATRTPLETLQAKYEKLREAIARGKLTSQEAAAAAKRHQDEYQQELEQSRRGQQQLTSSGVAWGVTMANVYAKVAQQVLQVFAKMSEEQAKLIAQTKEQGDAVGQLSQLQANTPQLVAASQALMASGAVKSIQEGKDAIFATTSAGAEESLPALGKLAGAGVIRNIPEVILSAESLRFTLGGEEAGSVQEILAKSFAAARQSTTTAERATIATAKSGTSARELGLSVDESMAMAGVMASAKGNAETAGERLAALFRGLKSKDELQGKTGAEMIEAIRDMKLGFTERQTYVGGSEADEALSVLMNKLALLRPATEAVSKARGAETLDAIAEDALSIRTVRLARDHRAMAAQADLAGEAVGNLGTAVETLFNEKVRDIRTNRRGGVVTDVTGHVAANTTPWMALAQDAMGGGAIRRLANTSVAAELDVAVVRTFEMFAKWVPGMQEVVAQYATASKETQATLREVSRDLKEASGALKATATRRDLIGPARREAAAAER
jgi:hypothetical protein